MELATGLRRGEVLALQWDDLDFSTGGLRIQRQVYRANGELVVSAPKTKAALRTIVLPPTLLGVLEEYHQQIDSRWMFPSPVKEDSPLDPATVRKHLQTILEHAGCKAAKIDRGIGKCEPSDETGEGFSTQPSETRSVTPFAPYKGKIRKPGTGCVTQINEHLWEGKFSPKWPDGKKHSRSVYASTETECEEKLADLIREMKTEIAEARRLVSEGNWEEAMALVGQKKAQGARKVV